MVGGGEVEVGWRWKRRRDIGDETLQLHTLPLISGFLEGGNSDSFVVNVIIVVLILYFD